MCFFMSLFPATFFLVIGFFILFVANKAEGGVRIFGIILAVWFFICAALFPIGGAFIHLTSSCPMTRMMQEMEIPIWKEQKY